MVVGFMQSVPIATKVVSMNPAHSDVYLQQHFSCIVAENLRFNKRSIFFYICRVGVMVFNAIFNNISVISWQLVLLMEENRGIQRGP
jgi:hypothetical protein